MDQNETPDQKVERLKRELANAERQAKVTALQVERQSRVNQLDAVLQGISFEHRSAYDLSVKIYGNGFYLAVTRKVPDSRTGQPVTVNNSQIVSGNVSNEAFVKIVFRAVGQFEAHEFAESFRLFDKHCYFPHNAEKGFAWFNQGEALNQRLLEVWRQVEHDKKDRDLALYHFGIWFKSWPVVVFCVKADAYLVSKWNAFESKISRVAFIVKLRFNKLRARLDSAVQAFKADPMDMPVTHFYTFVRHGDTLQNDSQAIQKTADKE